MTTSTPDTRPPGARPFWIPEDVKFDTLPPALQRAITEIVDPAYEELVLQAQTGLERSMGVSYVHLLWLALIEMIDIARDMGPGLARGQGTDRHKQKIGGHLRLVGQKDRIAKFLLEVHKFYDRGRDKDLLGGPR